MKVKYSNGMFGMDVQHLEQPNVFLNTGFTLF